MNEVYEKTALTRKSVACLSGYLDWNSQPRIFKHYPSFLFGYNYGEKEQLHIIELARMITSSQMIGSKPYHRLNTPSAGNLHPIELYVQIRAIKGIISGIYHVDASENKLVLIQEIEADGLEKSLGLTHKLEGMIFQISTVPYRSQWKYGDRAIRYCYQDVGHQIGAIEASATIHKVQTTILSDFDAKHLNQWMGFKDEESICAVMSIGSENTKEVKELSKPLIYVAPTDYSESNLFIANALAKEGVLKSRLPLLEYEINEEAILKRRSCRAFNASCLEKEDFDSMIALLSKPLSFMQCYSIVLKDDVLEKGIYLNGERIKTIENADAIVNLLVGQSFLKNATIIAVMCSKSFSADKLMLCANFAHALYLQAQSKELAFTGIGAFYDEKLKEYLGTQEHILYVGALGKQ